MIAHLEDRAAALMARGWTPREAEWLALVCLHIIGRNNPALAQGFIRRCRKYVVEWPWNSSRHRICRIAARRLYRCSGSSTSGIAARCAGGGAAPAAVARLPARTSAHGVASNRGREGGCADGGGDRCRAGSTWAR